MTCVGTVVEHVPEGVAVLDTGTGDVVEANEQLAGLCDRTQESLEDRSFRSLAPDGWSPNTEVETLVERARDGRVTFEWRAGDNRETATVLACAMEVHDADRAVVTVRERACGRTDADDRRTGTVDESTLLESLNDPAFVVDAAGRFVEVNHAAVDRFGYTREDLQSMGPEDLRSPGEVHSDDQPSGDADHFETAYVAASGEEIPVAVSVSEMTARGEPTEIRVARDVSDHKATAQRLETFERAVQQAGHAVYITDSDGTIEYVNPEFEGVTGYEATDVVGETPAVLKSGAQDEAYYESLWETILRGEVWEERVENERADGERYVADQTIAPIVKDGEVEKFVAIQQDVTERTEREAELERCHELIENVPIGVYRSTGGLAGEFVDVNPALVEMVGAESADELLGTHVAERYRTPGQRELIGRKIEQNGQIVEEEIRLETMDGEPFWGSVTSIRREVDGTVYYDGIVQDVTERREKERELKFRERRFRRLFEDHNAPMLLIDPETGRIERANGAAASFYGYDTETLESMTIQDINQLDDEAVAERRRAASEGETNRFIFPHELADGSVRQVEVDSSPIQTGGGTLLFSILHDVTERREKERELKFRERRFRRLFEDHNAPMLLVHPSTGAIERANAAASSFYGYGTEALESMSIQDINQLDDQQVAERREAAKAGETNRFVFPHELADGSVRQVEVDSSPIQTGSGTLLFSILHDVTDRERNRERIERQNEQLELLNRVVRHDIRNDMSVVTGYAELLEEHVDDAGHAHLETLLEHSEHVVELTKEARTLMKAMLDESDADEESVLLDDVLRSQVSEVRSGYEDATVTVETALPDVTVRGNEMLASVFRNLLRNAVQHNDSPDPTVRVSVEEAAETVKVHVADDGPGVPEDQKDAIFGKGEQGIESSGTGLGLYFVRTFVEQFGGEVWVSGNDPEGAVFTVELSTVER